MVNYGQSMGSTAGKYLYSIPVLGANQSVMNSGKQAYSAPKTYVPPTNNYSYTSPNGAVLGASTQRVPSPQQPDQQAPMEPTPQQDNINWDEIYAPAFQALDQAERAYQSSYGADVASTEADTASRKAQLASEEKARLENYGQQRQGETKRTEGAVAEARRMASQLLQGLQSQYGGSTGTGAFRGEQIGSAATQNIAGNREALQTALAGISASENALKDKVLTLQNEEDRNLQTAKLQLKAQLDKALADISGQRGKLNVDKGAQRADALNQYRQLLAEVEARNTQFKQQLYTQAQQQAQKLSQLKMSAQDKYSANLKMANLTNGQQFQVGNTAYQVAPTSEGNIQYLQGTVNQDAQDSNGDGIPDYLD